MGDSEYYCEASKRILPFRTRCGRLPQAAPRTGDGDFCCLIFNFQSQDGESARPHHAAIAPCPRRPSDRVTDFRCRLCQVVWEGRRREAPPYPDHWHRADLRGCPLIGRYRVVSGPIERQTRLAEFMSLRPKLKGI
jgi:hypothetical protein